MTGAVEVGGDAGVGDGAEIADVAAALLVGLAAEHGQGAGAVGHACDVGHVGGGGLADPQQRIGHEARAARRRAGPQRCLRARRGLQPQVGRPPVHGSDLASAAAGAAAGQSREDLAATGEDGGVGHAGVAMGGGDAGAVRQERGDGRGIGRQLPVAAIDGPGDHQTARKRGAQAMGAGTAAKSRLYPEPAGSLGFVG